MLVGMRARGGGGRRRRRARGGAWVASPPPPPPPSSCSCSSALALAQFLSCSLGCTCLVCQTFHTYVSGLFLGCRIAHSTDFQQHLASFLLTRGDYNWFGHGWISTRPPVW
jgi:hypothetical protein